MKKNFLFCIGCMIVIVIMSISCTREPSGKPNVLYDWFEYQGKDPVFDTFKINTVQYQNPVLAGFYPDPSICRVDSDYYLVNSTFSYFPGIPIFHSRDLVHWKQIGHVLNRPSQLNLDTLQLSWGVFAPAIQYHNGIFYVINTLVFAGGNFYVTAADPAGPWSDPVWLHEIDGIDPSFFFDDNGKAYIVNNGPPVGDITYEGHRAIWIQEFLPDSGKLTGPRKVIVNAGVKISEKPVWIEGPHVFKKDGFYYLIAAEGGTSTGHSEVVFRSKSVWGPYVPSTINPILTQRHLDNNRRFPVTSTGHADFIQTQEGAWWAVFLGCRPYEDDFYNTGRETFMLPVSWENGWPFVTGKEVPYVVTRPDLPEYSIDAEAFTGNFTWRDEFNDSLLGMKWNFIRTPREKWYSLDAVPGSLKIDLLPVSIRELKNPSFIGRRQQHSFFTCMTALKPQNFDTMANAGIIAFQNEKHYIYMGIRKHQNNYSVFLERAGSDDNNGIPRIVTSEEIGLPKSSLIYLKIEGRGSVYDFYHSTDATNWTLLKADVDAHNLSTHVGGGFVGAYLGMYGSALSQ